MVWKRWLWVEFLWCIPWTYLKLTIFALKMHSWNKSVSLNRRGLFAAAMLILGRVTCKNLKKISRNIGTVSNLNTPPQNHHVSWDFWVGKIKFNNVNSSTWTLWYPSLPKTIMVSRGKMTLCGPFYGKPWAQQSDPWWRGRICFIVFFFPAQTLKKSDIWFQHTQQKTVDDVDGNRKSGKKKNSWDWYIVYPH